MLIITEMQSEQQQQPQQQQQQLQLTETCLQEAGLQDHATTGAVVEPPTRISPYVVRSCCSQEVTRFRDRQALMLGVVQMIIGVLCLSFSVAAMSMNEELSFFGFGNFGVMLVSWRLDGARLWKTLIFNWLPYVLTFQAS